MIKNKPETTSFSLHILAMLFMLIDHAGIILFPKVALLRCIGRLAFPIFAFMATEGYFHTKNLGKYMLRLFTWAVISEIPYNILKTGTIVDFARRNVLWTLLFGVILVYIIDRIREKYGTGPILLASLIITAPVCYVFGVVVRADYGYGGLFMILAFYIFRGKSLPLRACQFIAMFIINSFLLSNSPILPGIVEFPRQSLAVFALIPIWLYKGRVGYKSRFMTWIYYAFYPLHIILLVILFIIFRR